MARAAPVTPSRAKPGGAFRVRWQRVPIDFAGGVDGPLNTLEYQRWIPDEDNGLPNVEGRIALGLGKPTPIGIGLLTQRPVEVGVSGVAGPAFRRTSFPPNVPRRVVSDVWGAAVDYRVNLTGFFLGFKGEVYTGQGLGNYNGGILQTLDAVTWEPIRATGGWVEGFVYLTPNLHSHAGYGIDDPNPPTSRPSHIASAGGPTTARSGAI